MGDNIIHYPITIYSQLCNLIQMSHFDTPEIKKKWGSVLKRPTQTFLRDEIIVKQGEPFIETYLIIRGEVEAYREVSSRKLGIVCHISLLGPYDVISVDEPKARYSMKVTSNLLRAIKLQQNQKDLVSGSAVKQWRNMKAQSLQRKYDISRSLKKKKSAKKLSLAIIRNTSLQKQLTQSQSRRLPTLIEQRRGTSTRSTTLIDSKRAPLCKNPQILFQSIMKNYLAKKMDYESKNVNVPFNEMTRPSKILSRLCK